MLFKLVYKSVVQRPLRYVLTSFAIIFSVAAVTGVFIFTGGLRVTFGELAESIESGYDIAVQPTDLFGATDTNVVPVDQLDVIAGVDGVGTARPRILNAPVVPIDGSGEPIYAPSGPNLGVLWGDRSENINLFAQEGERPDADDEFAMDIDTFAAGDFEIGERYSISFPSEIEEGATFELTGTFTFGSPDRNALLGAAITAFDETTALEALQQGRGYTDIVVELEEGADQASVIDAISEVVDDDLRVRSQQDVLEETKGDFGEILTIFQTVLLAFAVIISFVSAFLIFNVFTITLGQRIRELGLLRAVGALGSQVTRLMLGEALMLGVLSTLIGIPAGLGLAYLLRLALGAVGFPDNTGLPISPWTIFFAAVVGIGVTLAAALFPAVQASRVPPLAAMRNVVATEFGAKLDRRVAVVVAILGVAAIARGFAATGWLSILVLPIVGAFLLWLALRTASRTGADFVVLPLGIVFLLVPVFVEYGLSVTFGLIGAGTVVSLFGAFLVSPRIVGPISQIFGRLPSMILFGFLGVAFGLGALAMLGGAGLIAATGVPDAVIDATGEAVSPVALIVPLVIGAIVMAIAGYGVARTAYGARGLAGQVARANATRNPQRTATTAAALMIGLTLVTAVTVIGDSIKSSVSEALHSSIRSDFLVQGAQNEPGGSPFPATAADRIEALDEVESVERFRVAFPAAWATSESGELRAEDLIEFLPIITQLLDDSSDLSAQDLLALQDELGTDIDLEDASATEFDVLEDHIDPVFISRDADLASQENAIYLFEDVAADKGLSVGDTFSVLFPDLESEDLVVAGIFENGFVLGNRVVTVDLWERHFTEESDNFLTVVTSSGVTEDDARAAIEGALEDDFSILTVFTREEFAAQAELQLNQLLAVINVLLGLSALIAALGILVALALSVFERTREIGLFRAVGATRAQTRWIIRWEGVIIAFFGAFMGILLGIGIGILVASKLPDVVANTVTVPISTLVAYLVFAALTGLGAAVFPAWIAGRMNVLDAVSSE